MITVKWPATNNDEFWRLLRLLDKEIGPYAARLALRRHKAQVARVQEAYDRAYLRLGEI